VDTCLLGFLLLDKKKSETLPLKADFPLFDTTAAFSLQLSGFEACTFTTMLSDVDEITGTDLEQQGHAPNGSPTAL